MSSVTENKGVPSDAQLSAPWYITGKLEAHEARDLEELAREDPEFARLLREAELEAEAAVAVNQSLPEPSPQVWRRLESSIAAQPNVRRLAGLRSGATTAKGALADFFSGFSGPRWQMAGVAALVLCVVQAGTIAYLLQSSDQGSKFTVASGPKDAPRPSAAFLVTFSETATIIEIGTALDEAGVKIVEGPVSGTLYRVGLKDVNLTSKDAALKKLRSSTAVKMVLPQK